MEKQNNSAKSKIIKGLRIISICGLIVSLFAPLFKGDFSADTFGEFIVGVIIMPFLTIFIYTFGLFTTIINYEGSRSSWFSWTGAFTVLFYLSIIIIITTRFDTRKAIDR